MSTTNNKGDTWSLATNQIFEQLEYNIAHNCVTKLSILKQGTWEIILLCIPQDGYIIRFYAKKYESKSDTISYGDYVQLYRENSNLGTLSTGKIPVFITQKIVSVGKALEKRGCSVPIKQTIISR